MGTSTVSKKDQAEVAKGLAVGQLGTMPLMVWEQNVAGPVRRRAEAIAAEEAAKPHGFLAGIHSAGRTGVEGIVEGAGKAFDVAQRPLAAFDTAIWGYIKDRYPSKDQFGKPTHDVATLKAAQQA